MVAPLLNTELRAYKENCPLHLLGRSRCVLRRIGSAAAPPGAAADLVLVEGTLDDVLAGSAAGGL
jgi:hypothetical protein